MGVLIIQTKAKCYKTFNDRNLLNCPWQAPPYILHTFTPATRGGGNLFFQRVNYYPILLFKPTPKGRIAYLPTPHPT
jgi:hypothetical protein